MDKKDERKSFLLVEINSEELFSNVECRCATTFALFCEIASQNLSSFYWDIIKLWSEELMWTNPPNAEVLII